MPERAYSCPLDAFFEATDVEPGEIVEIPRSTYINLVNLGEFDEDEVSTGVFLGVLASDLNISGLAFHNIKESSTLHLTIIVKKLDTGASSQKTFARCEQDLAALCQKFGAVIKTAYRQINKEDFLIIAERTREEAADPDSKMDLFCFFQFV
ncbi:hypothetical protein A2164_00475 [Candidatus Curtissbacteria bacterium RBG_13_35_7]|uniref:Uncharacterized protein n=1 Tax=Candidatus Curtissbacteria bacterium RBG_13_35_7 TaxID=1797705 RepID=A0A1F5G260_9BACT|nr:MAG: hypothetical protein A2164_00475 [Candidatus Curtissbacteria bacterium RBG_13_35_7]